MAKSVSLADMTETDLLELLDETKDELFNLRFQLVTGQLDNSSRVKEIKKQVARVKTAIREREIAAAEAIEGGATPTDAMEARDEAAGSLEAS